MLTYVLLVLFLICSLLLILLILIQKGRGAGLAGAFGGGGGQSAFGTKTADILTKATAVLTAAFFLLALVSGWYINRQAFGGSSQTPAQKTPGQPGDGANEGTPAAPTGDTGATPSDAGATPPADSGASSNAGAGTAPATDGGDN
ncbi:MAG: preprotein translocase subunit SecG [Planctomycetes bacterium]|nr:preprotein translocase subunit SecG [Planctomycetota bacterium]